jgi:Right handed beta helix region
VSATYYVKSTGSDGAAGTSPGTAWKTLTPVNSHTFVPGDTVLFNGGDTFTGGIFVQNVASTSANPVTFGSYGTGKATISSTAGTVGCYIYRMGGVVIQNLNFTGPGVATANKEGVLCYNDAVSTVYPYIRINGCAVTGYTNGIAIGGGAGSSGYSDVRIENCDCYVNVLNGMLIFAVNNNTHSNVYIGYCRAYNNPGKAAQSSPTGSGIQIGEVNGCTVEYCSAYGNGASNTAAQGPVGIWCYDSTGVTIQFCESYNNTSGGGDGDGFDIDGGCTNCIIQYCYSHGNKSYGFALFQYAAASTFSGNIIRYCISENDKLAGFALWGADASSKITNSQVYNNTIYASLGPALDVLNSNLTNITVSNNIFLTTGGQPLIDYAGTTGLTFTKNNYFNLSGAFAIWWGGTSYSSVVAWGQDAGGLSVNPVLSNPGSGGTVGDATKLSTLTAYTISSASSPMVNAGAVISSPGTVDFYGDALFSGAPDIGADEYIPTIVPRSNKRSMVLGLDGSYRMVLPAPDGAISAADRYQLSGKYSLAAAAVVFKFRNRTGDRFRLSPSFPC